MTEDEKITKYMLACQMLVDLAADDVNIRGMALELKMANRYAQDPRFNAVVAKIADAYQHA